MGKKKATKQVYGGRLNAEQTFFPKFVEEKNHFIKAKITYILYILKVVVSKWLVLTIFCCWFWSLYDVMEQTSTSVFHYVLGIAW